MWTCWASTLRSGPSWATGWRSPRRGSRGAILFSGDRPNSPGVVTEIQTQRLPNRNALPSPDKYRFMAFHSFDGEPVAVNVRPGTYACAVRFFDAVTGQSSSPWEVGIVTIQAGGILAA